MCVLCYKPKNIELPPHKVLRACCLANPDGMGFATSGGEYFRTLDFGEFCRRLSKIGKSEAVMFHFRLATHGSVRTANCHPFYDESSELFFAHNGVLPHVVVSNDMTDSETVFRKHFAPVFQQCGNDLTDRYFNYVVKQFLGASRFAFMHGSDVRLFGEYTLADGVYYSNQRWCHYLHDSYRYMRLGAETLN
ncbi:MAG: class II glutamine amidotransferase [Bacteroidales bacterium]|nr:class II glutamine amidotransferase [Bacteroidales bacterium]